MTDERPILEGSGAQSSLPPQRRPTSTERVRHCRRRKRDDSNSPTSSCGNTRSRTSAGEAGYRPKGIGSLGTR